MVIRQKQMRSFEEAGARGFEDRMIERLRTYFPKHEKCLGEPQLRVMVQFAVERAQSHVLTAERSIALYLDLMCVLGSGFDLDPQIPWAAAILADRSFPTQAERIDLLHSRAWEYAQKVSVDFQNPTENREGSRLIAGFREIRQKSVEQLSPETARQTAHEISGRLKTLFPVKSETIGDECIQLLVRRAMETAVTYGIRITRGMWLFAALMFVAGAGFDHDPQLPWASRTLSDKSIADPAELTNRLLAEARAALKQWWGIDLGAEG